MLIRNLITVDSLTNICYVTVKTNRNNDNDVVTPIIKLFHRNSASVVCCHDGLGLLVIILDFV